MNQISPSPAGLMITQIERTGSESAVYLTLFSNFSQSTKLMIQTQCADFQFFLGRISGRDLELISRLWRASNFVLLLTRADAFFKKRVALHVPAKPWKLSQRESLSCSKFVVEIGTGFRWFRGVFWLRCFSRFSSGYDALLVSLLISYKCTSQESLAEIAIGPRNVSTHHFLSPINRISLCSEA